MKILISRNKVEVAEAAPMSIWQQLCFQFAFSPLIIKLETLHHYLIIILAGIATLTLRLILFIVTNKTLNLHPASAQQLEIAWTLIPSVILVAVAIPSLQALYFADEVPSPNHTLKVVAHQWYWTYEIGNISTNAYLAQNVPRLLISDNIIPLPCLTSIRVLVSRTDVIHRWALPSIGLKVDAIPGRLNILNLTSLKPGTVFGQCSEICGANHSFIPITIQFLVDSK